MMKVKGAEATVELNEENVIKRREQKKYRHPEIDSRIRDERTGKEAKLIEEARKHGVSTPEVKKEDSSTLKVEKIEGKPLREVLEEGTALIKSLGENVALLHYTDIIHGDLTTSNCMVTPEKQLYLIDFGLSFRSQRTEDKAVDIHLLKQVLNSSHPELAEKAWNQFLEGYREYSESDKVLEQLKEVEQRGRYK